MYHFDVLLAFENVISGKFVKHIPQNNAPQIRRSGNSKKRRNKQ